MNSEIVSKIKELAYENVNKKIEEEKKETERKINQEIEVVEEILKYIKNKLLFKNIGDTYYPNYILVTEEIFFKDYNSVPKYDWHNKIEIIHDRKKKWEPFIKVRGHDYYDIRYLIRHYEEDFEALSRRLNNLREDFRKIENVAEDLKKQEPKIKKLIEQYQQVEIIEES